MLRAILFRLWPILLLLLVAWVIFWFLFKKNKEADAIPPWQTKLWLSTFAAAIVILLTSIILMVFQFDDNADKKYMPAYIENGVVVKGKMVESDASK